MRSLSRKQVAAISRLWVRVPRLPRWGMCDMPRSGIWAHGPTGRHRSCKPEIRVRFPMGPLMEFRLMIFDFQLALQLNRKSKLNKRSRGPAATTPRSHRGNGGSSPSGINRLDRQPADHFGLNPEMLRVRIPREPLGIFDVRFSISDFSGMPIQNRQSQIENDSGSVGNGRPPRLRPGDAVGSSPT
jgi:hypothetical protein